MRITESQLRKIIREELERGEEAAVSRDEAVSQLKSSFKSGPAETRSFLNSSLGMSSLVREDILMAAELDGDLSDDVVKVTNVSGESALSFLPTQSYIDLMQSVSYPLGSSKTLIRAIKRPAASGLVTSDGYIIDGHHRWSSAISIGGERAAISGKNVSWPGENFKEKLASAQLTIAAYLGPGKKQPSASGSPETDIFGKSESELSQMIMDNVNNQTDPGAPGPLLNDKMVEDLLVGNDGKMVQDWLGGLGNRVQWGKISPEGAYQLRLAIAQKVAENLAKPGIHVPENKEAPDREDMPQFDPKRGGPRIKDVQGGLEAGKFNVELPFAESKNYHDRSDRDLLIDRWQRLSGIIKS